MNTNKLFSYETFVHAVSGAAGGVTAMTVFFPLDTIRSRLQVEESREAKNTILAIQELIEQEGISSLYRGLQPVLSSLCCSNFVYFYTFHGLRSLVETNNTGKNAVRDLTVAAIAESDISSLEKESELLSVKAEEKEDISIFIKSNSFRKAAKERTAEFTDVEKQINMKVEELRKLS